MHMNQTYKRFINLDRFKYLFLYVSSIFRISIRSDIHYGLETVSQRRAQTSVVKIFASLTLTLSNHLFYFNICIYWEEKKI